MMTTKNVLVLGATGGIGEAVALFLAEQGFNIGVHYSSNQTKADELARTIQSMGVKSAMIQGDVAEENAMA